MEFRREERGFLCDSRLMSGVDRSSRLKVIKVAHTIVWALFVACIGAIPLASWQGKHGAAALFASIVLGEVVVLALNRWSCPLTAVAARYTSDREANFDIYLPLWIARYNKEIFGPLYVAGVILALVRWAWSGG